MTLKLIGAGLIVLSCGGFGFSMANFHRREEENLRQFIIALNWMEMELPSSLSPLSVLCHNAATQISGSVQELLHKLSVVLDQQTEPDARICVERLTESMHLSECMSNLFLQLGATLGRFDLPGQLQGLRSLKARASHALLQLENNRTARLRSYQTLGLCAGASLAILLL